MGNKADRLLVKIGVYMHMSKSIASILMMVMVFVLTGCQTKLQGTVDKLEPGMSKEAAWDILKRYGKPEESWRDVPVMVDKDDRVLTFLRKDSVYINPEKSKERFGRLCENYKKSGDFEKEESCRLVLEGIEEFQKSGNRISYVELWIYSGQESTDYKNIFVVFKNNRYAFHLALGYNQRQAEADYYDSQRRMMAASMLMQQGNAYNYQIEQQRYHNQQNMNLQNINNSLMNINATLKGL